MTEERKATVSPNAIALPFVGAEMCEVVVANTN
jgi:hypothetical protein